MTTHRAYDPPVGADPRSRTQWTLPASSPTTNVVASIHAAAVTGASPTQT